MKLQGKILLAGDWHGNTTQAMNVIGYAHREKIRTIIQLGDFGIWRNDEKFLFKLERQLAKYGIDLYFIDGNHENFDKLYTYTEEDNGTRIISEHITHLPRGFRIQWEGLDILCVGGAASIDKDFREEGVSWWPEEYISLKDVSKATERGNTDILLTHDSPASAPNSIVDDEYMQTMARRDLGDDVLDYCAGNRNRLQMISDATTPSLIFHGHYHIYMTGVFRHQGLIQSSAGVVGLDQGTKGIKEHTATLDPEEVHPAIERLVGLH